MTNFVPMFHALLHAKCLSVTLLFTSFLCYIHVPYFLVCINNFSQFDQMRTKPSYFVHGSIFSKKRSVKFRTSYRYYLHSNFGENWSLPVKLECKNVKSCVGGIGCHGNPDLAHI